jgi:hypothetical protein
MAKTKTKPRGGRLLDQAALEAIVRFGPQLDALKQLQHQAHQTFGTRVTAANATAGAIHGAVDVAAPKVAGAYDEAGLRQAAIAGTLINTDLAGLGPSADRFKAAGAVEAAGAADRLNAGRSQALTDLANRGVEAEAGRTQAVRTAGDQLAGDLQRIGDEKVSLIGQAGAFKASQLADLREAERQRAFTASENAANRANARGIAAGHDAVSLSNAATSAASKGKGGKGSRGRLPGGVPLATPTEHGNARDSIEGALQEAKTFKAHGGTRPDVGKLLITGAPAQTKKDKNGDSQHIPGVTPHKALYVRVALDLAYDGHISPDTAKLLHKRGLSVKRLGYPLLNKAQRRAGSQAQGAGAIAGTLAQLLGLGA